MKIEKTDIAKIKDAEELIEYVAINRYDSFENLESDEFQQLPEWIKDIVFILDFETEYEMQGLPTYLVNSTGHYLPETIQSFKRTDNNDIADILVELQDTLASVDLSPDILRNSEDDLNLEDYPEIGEKVDEIDDRLREFIEEKEFWNKVTEYVQRKINQ
ncbi:MAG: DUF4375 domain-containing protein [Tannerella sp.]|nr:DUF4375 domain-containing protein [Tannerella sp.]